MKNMRNVNGASGETGRGAIFFVCEETVCPVREDDIYYEPLLWLARRLEHVSLDPKVADFIFGDNDEIRK